MGFSNPNYHSSNDKLKTLNLDFLTDVVKTNLDGLVTLQLHVLSSETPLAEEYEAVRQFRLEQNHPNPFNASTVINYNLSVSGYTAIFIYNLYGQKIKTLVMEQKSSSAYRELWDGRADNGEDTASGVYIYQIESGHFSQSRKMLLMR